MQTKRKVRKDFDPKKVYAVDVSGCTVLEKVAVQQAFYDVGLLWSYASDETYRHLDAAQYTNTRSGGYVTEYLMYSGLTEDCNMTATEFLDTVYEPEQQGHVPAELTQLMQKYAELMQLMQQYAEDAKTHAEPWELWQFSTAGAIWYDLNDNPTWCSTLKYRRKPKTHCVNGAKIPDLRFTPKDNEDYYCPLPHNPVLVQAGTYLQSYAPDAHRSEHGLCYEYSEEGKQAAILHAKAWLNGGL